jgi:AcrR family transcriptional regulator
MPEPKTPTQSAPRAAAPRWRRRAEARPGEIIEAALELFGEKGFAATSMQEIARRAGVTKGTLYLYFPSKEELFHAVVQETLVPALVLGEQRVAEATESTPELFREMIWRWWARYDDPRAACLPKLLMAEAANFPELATFYVDTVIHRGRKIIAKVIERGIERGEFRAVDVPTAVRLALAPLLSLGSYRRSLLPYDSEPWEAEPYIELHIETFLRGMAKEP